MHEYGKHPTPRSLCSAEFLKHSKVLLFLLKMVDFMDLEEDYNDISVRGAQRRGQKYHCNPTLSP